MGEKLKIKLPIAKSYLLFAISVALVVLYLIPTPHHLNTTYEDLKNIEDYFLQAQDFTLVCKVNTNVDKMDFATHLTEIFPKLKYEDDLGKYLKGNNQDQLVLLDIICQNSGEKTIQINSLAPLHFTYQGSCDDFAKSKPLRREFKRIIHAFSQDAISDLSLKLSAEIYNFNLVFISSHKSQEQSNDQIRQKVALTIRSLMNKIDIPDSSLRFNIQNFNQEDIDFLLPEKEITPQHISSLTEYLLELRKANTYNFESENINLYFILDQNKALVDEDATSYDYADETREKDALLVVRNSTNLDLALFTMFYRLFELDKISDLSTNIKVKYEPHMIFEQFALKRRNFLLTQIAREINSFGYTLNDTEIVVTKEIGAQIDEFIAKVKEMIKSDKLSNGDLHKIHREFWGYNHFGQKNFGHRDAFPNDYKIGVYVPLFVPLLLPALRAWIQIIKKKKNKKNIAQK